ncbi:MAG: sigma-70 family RNA polymerase sigma factor [Myxococcota bacterium]
MKSLETDRSLLDGFRRGQRRALEQVYALYADGVAQFLRGGFVFESKGTTIRYQGAPSEFHLEDWVHDVFIRAFSEAARRQYDGLRPYGPYLQRIARNVVIDELRRKEHQLRAHVAELPEPEVDTDYAATGPRAPDEEAEQRQLNAHVADFIAALPEREQQVYRLRFVEGLDQRDVAAQSGLSASKVKTSERRIRTGFYRYLKDRGWLDEPAIDEDVNIRKEANDG